MSRALGAMFRSLSLRLLAGLLLTVAVVLGVYAVIVWRTAEEQWLRLAEDGASRTSDLVERATYYAMLGNQKEDMHRTLRRIARGPGVAGIRVYDKQGAIIFSDRDGEVGTTVDLEAEACVGCHRPGEPLRAVSGGRLRTFRTQDGGGVMGLIRPIENQPECANAACHAHPASQTVLGVLDVRMKTDYMADALRATRARLLWATAVLLGVMGAGAGLFVDRLVRRPIRRLQEGTRRIAAGDLQTRLGASRDDELGDLARAFDGMTSELARAREELTEWSRSLEAKVVEKTEELSRVERQVLHMEKMASLGRLSATVAHELNNPLSGVLTYAKLVERQLRREPLSPESREEMARSLQLIQRETARCGDIVKNLLLFARKSGAAFAPASLNDVVERSLMLVRHHLEMHAIRLEKGLLPGDDGIVCDAAQIQQALVALLINAVEAMTAAGSGGTLGVHLRHDAEAVEIRVSDTGVGMAPDVIPHVFEPFFSTKDKESGVGLGLAVVYGIVERHGGTIGVQSEPGQGSTFTMRLPRTPAVSGGERPSAGAGSAVAAPAGKA